MEVVTLKTATKDVFVEIIKFRDVRKTFNFAQQSLARYLELGNELPTCVKKYLGKQVEMYHIKEKIRTNAFGRKTSSYDIESPEADDGMIVMESRWVVRCVNKVWYIGQVYRKKPNGKRTLLKIKILSSRPVAVDLRSHIVVKFDVTKQMQAAGELGILALVTAKDRKNFPTLISYDLEAGVTVFYAEKLYTAAEIVIHLYPYLADDERINRKQECFCDVFECLDLSEAKYDSMMTKVDNFMQPKRNLVNGLVNGYKLQDVSDQYYMSNWALVKRGRSFVPYVFDYGFLGWMRDGDARKRFTELKRDVVKSVQPKARATKHAFQSSLSQLLKAA